MLMRWEILSKRVQKNLSIDILKNLVFHVQSRIRSIKFSPCNLVLTFVKWYDCFFRLRWKMTWCNMNYHIKGLRQFWDNLYFRDNVISSHLNIGTMIWSSIHYFYFFSTLVLILGVLGWSMFVKGECVIFKSYQLTVGSFELAKLLLFVFSRLKTKAIHSCLNSNLQCSSTNVFVIYTAQRLAQGEAYLDIWQIDKFRASWVNKIGLNMSQIWAEMFVDTTENNMKLWTFG